MRIRADGSLQTGVVETRGGGDAHVVRPSWGAGMRVRPTAVAIPLDVAKEKAQVAEMRHVIRFAHLLWNFANGTPIFESIGVNPSTGGPADIKPLYFRSTDIGLFIQDDWKIRHNLTINLASAGSISVLRLKLTAISRTSFPAAIRRRDWPMLSR